MKRVALALVVLLALTGCATTGSLVDKAQIDLGLQRLTSDLTAVPGVIDVDSHAELQGDYSYVISIAATADELSDEALLQVGTIAAEQLGSGVFTRHRVAFSVGMPEATLLGMNRFIGIDLDTELAYRSALSAAYGAPLGINFYDDSRQIYALEPTAGADWAAMRAIPDSSTLERTWALGGIWAVGEFPDTVTTDLADALRAIGSPDGVTVELSETQVTLMDSAYTDLADPPASPHWAIALQIAAAVSASGLELPHLAYYGDGGTGFAVAFHGECSVDDLLVHPEDEALATALAASLGDAAWQPGYCPIPQ